MGATLYKEHKVFVMDLGLADDSLFGTETVVAASLKCDKNCYPHVYHWGIDFIGGAQSFTTEYLPRTAYFFTDGIAQGPGLPNGKAFEKLMEQLYSNAGPLTVQEMHKMGFFGYSWSISSGNTIFDRSSLTLVSIWLGERYAASVDSQQDIDNMVHQAYEVMESADSAPWLPGLWPISRESMAVLNQPLSDDRQVSL